MSTEPTGTDAAARASVLHRIVFPEGGPRRPMSPESSRISNRIVASFTGLAIMVYATSNAHGTPRDLPLLAAMIGGWLSLLLHEMREATRARKV